MRLVEIANIQMGYAFRNALKASPHGRIAVIQMKDLAAEGTVDCSGLTRVEMDDPSEHHLVQRGDLVFRSRGLVSTSAILRENPGKGVVAAPLLRIRVDNPDVLLPEYLNWYIGQRDAQGFLSSRAKGTAQKMISIDVLQDLEVVVPSVAVQKRIVDLASLSVVEQRLIHTIAEKRRHYISKSLIQAAKGD